MAERKTSTSSTLHSKGSTGEFAKQVQRKFSRAQEKVLQKFGKSVETRDTEFGICVQNFQDQQRDGQRLYKDIKAYLNAVRVMRDASSRLFQSLYDVYELDWEGGEELGAVVEGEDLLWNDYEAKLRDQAVLTLESYLSQFPDMRDRVAKRGRKLVDYDSSRHHLESLQSAKKRDDIKINKAEEETKISKSIFEDMNRELKEELPLLYDSRIGCFVTVFQAISNLRDIFYKEMSQNNKDLQNIMMNLKAQHPDKSFVVKNFNRGTLKRRSLKDALSPRFLKPSFSERHMNSSFRGTLRKEHTFSFGSDNGPCEPYSPEVPSPARPKPPKDTTCGIADIDTDSTCEDIPEVEETSSNPPAPLVDDTKASRIVHSCSNNDTKQENEGTKTKVKETLPTSDQDGERMGFDLRDDSFPESGDEHKLGLNINHSEKANTEVLSLTEDSEEHENQPEERNEPGSVMENGIATNCKANIEGIGVSHKENVINDQILDEIEKETF